MAGGKMTPRLKMITLMYLVFISMLAMNMSKEVLASFGVIHEKLALNNDILFKKNTSAIDALKLKAKESPDQFAEVADQAIVVDDASNIFYEYLENVKQDLLNTTNDKKDYTAMDKSAPFDEKFFVGSPDRKKFLEMFETYRTSVEPVLKKSYPSIVSQFNADFNLSRKIKNREGVEIKYLEYHFLGFPLVSTVAKLSFLQNNIRNYEGEILSKFLAGQLIKIASMDNYTTLLELKKTAFYSGDIFNGSVVLGRKDASTKPNSVKLTFGSRKLSKSEYKIEDGKVQLKFRTPSPGDYPLKGELIFLQEGKKISVPVNSTITVINRPTQAVISAEKMNVVYRGVENPINISLPGVAANKLRVSAPGLIKKGNVYVIKPRKGRQVEIKVSATIDRKIVTSSRVFRIKDIPRPSGTVSKQPESLKLPLRNLEIATIGAILEDFDFDLKLKVNSFKVSVPGQPSVNVNGSRMDARAKRVLSRARQGDIIQIFDINASIVGNSSYKLKKVSSVTVEIQ